MDQWGWEVRVRECERLLRLVFRQVALLKDRVRALEQRVRELGGR